MSWQTKGLYKLQDSFRNKLESTSKEVEERNKFIEEWETPECGEVRGR